MKILVILQNAWRHDAEPEQRTWLPESLRARVEAAGRSFEEVSRRSWLIALWRSHTGCRLRSILPEGHEIVICEASPRVGATSGKTFAMEPDHVIMELHRHGPGLVVLLGREAQRALSLCGELPVVVGPHPAWRGLTKASAAVIQSEIQAKAH